jgi:hypothetical protein
MRLQWGMGAILISTMTLSACCTERTVTFYRGATAEAPQLPSRFGAPLKAEQIQIAAELNPVLINGITTHENDRDSAAAMWIPRLQFGGHFYRGLSDKIEAGVQVRGSKSEWASPTTTEALDLKRDGRHVIQGGLGLRANLSEPDNALQFSLLTEFNLVFREELIEKHSYCSSGWGSSNTWGTSCYGLTSNGEREGKGDMGANLIAGINTAWEVVPHLHLLGLAAVALHGTNNYSDTVTYNPEEESEPDGRSWSPTPLVHLGAGLEFRLRPFLLNAIAHYPMTARESLQYGPAVSATTGLYF